MCHFCLGDLGDVGYTYTSVGGVVSLQLITDGVESSSGFTGSLTKVYSGTDLKGNSVCWMCGRGHLGVGVWM